MWLFSNSDTLAMFRAIHPLNTTDTFTDAGIVQFQILGPGAPEGEWLWISQIQYLVFSPYLLETISVGLLSPSITDLVVNLYPGICPDVDYTLSSNNNNTDIIYTALLNAIGPIPQTSFIAFRPRGSENLIFYSLDSNSNLVIQDISVNSYPILLALLVVSIILPIILSLLCVGITAYLVKKRYTHYKEGLDVGFKYQKKSQQNG